ncbi:MAG: heat-shock protein Hsp20 [Bacteroidetes bacterium]|nr:MAG: heat-shock protein Hsp20 [Bacteroidota bacterium]
MNYNQSWAAKGQPGSRHMLIRSMQRAAVNVYKTADSFEMLVFAPGRIREHFQIDLNGNELSISYTPPEGFPRPDWILREYSRGAFVRKFSLDESVDINRISAKYVDGVLQVSLPIIPGKELSTKQILID